MFFKVLCDERMIEGEENFRIVSKDVFDIFVSSTDHLFSKKNDAFLALEMPDTGRRYILGEYSKPKYAAIALEQLYEDIDSGKKGVLSALTEKEIIELEKEIANLNALVIEDKQKEEMNDE